MCELIFKPSFSVHMHIVLSLTLYRCEKILQEKLDNSNKQKHWTNNTSNNPVNEHYTHNGFESATNMKMEERGTEIKPKGHKNGSESGK